MGIFTLCNKPNEKRGQRTKTNFPGNLRCSTEIGAVYTHLVFGCIYLLSYFPFFILLFLGALPESLSFSLINSRPFGLCRRLFQLQLSNFLSHKMWKQRACYVVKLQPFGWAFVIVAVISISHQPNYLIFVFGILGLFDWINIHSFTAFWVSTYEQVSFYICKQVLVFNATCCS